MPCSTGAVLLPFWCRSVTACSTHTHTSNRLFLFPPLPFLLFSAFFFCVRACVHVRNIDKVLGGRVEKSLRKQGQTGSLFIHRTIFSIHDQRPSILILFQIHGQHFVAMNLYSDFLAKTVSIKSLFQFFQIQRQNFITINLDSLSQLEPRPKLFKGPSTTTFSSTWEVI